MTLRSVGAFSEVWLLEVGSGKRILYIDLLLVTLLGDESASALEIWKGIL